MHHRIRCARPLFITISCLIVVLASAAASADTIMRATYENGRTDSGYAGIGASGCCAYSLNPDGNLRRTGNLSIRSTLRYGDPEVSGGPRAESDTVNLTAARFQPGQTTWYGFSLYIPSTWQDDATAEDIVFQWHHTKSSCDDPNRSPAMFLEVLPPSATAASRFRLRVNSDPVLCDHRDNADANLTKTSYDLVALTKGVWHDFVLQVDWSYTRTGSITAWHQTSKLPGWTQVLNAQNVANTYNSGTGTFGYLKWGIYKPAWRQGPTAVTERVVWHDNVAVAPDSSTGFQDADPSA
ncbi:hypothetical protein GCM10009850_079910 [Nonomuraea monospora]|uniref:Polysaccharide lyase-like protein n=1 Tax=Nonomuraea monospora TaxID=568818 RepID=A0ABP5PM43_9ACTN